MKCEECKYFDKTERICYYMGENRCVDNEDAISRQATMERCETCKYYRRLKHNFKHGKGFDESYACVIYVNDRDAFVLEVNADDMCEMYSKANHE